MPPHLTWVDEFCEEIATLVFFILERAFHFSNCSKQKTYSPVHVIFVHVIFLDTGNFPTFLKFLQWKITSMTLSVSAITLFLYRVTVNFNDYSIEEILLYNSCL